MDLPDRMKSYEEPETGRKIVLGLPVLARLDGRTFHTLTHRMQRPYDETFHQMMVATAKELVDESSALLAYVQSDEITLVWEPAIDTDPWFGGRIHKWTSLLASIATSKFNDELSQKYPVKHNSGSRGTFDCRVWQVPNRAEACNSILWREQDASKNSVNAAAQAQFSIAKIHGLHSAELQELLWQEKQINWNDYPAWAKRGTYLRRVRKLSRFSSEEIERLPPRHNARKNPDFQFARTVIEPIEMPILSTVQNRELVVFESAEPVIDKHAK